MGVRCMAGKEERRVVSGDGEVWEVVDKIE